MKMSSILQEMPLRHEGLPSRADVMMPVFERHFADRARPINVLEIGVFRAGLIKGFFEQSSLKIGRYDGVDPYLGDESDPYLNSYWKNRPEALSVYDSARATFESFGQPLHRKMSYEFAVSLDAAARYDVIYVDGDHRFEPALWDISYFFKHVADGGLLAIDDYANVDTPQVTPACNEFIRTHQANIRRIGYVPIWFVNKGKEVPVVQVTLFIEPMPDAEKVDCGGVLGQPSRRVDARADLAPPTRRLYDRIMELSPRKAAHFVKKHLTGTSRANGRGD
jgi:Methyltransferase domain